MKNGFRFIIPVPRWQSVGVQMFMNMNSERMASFPDGNNCYVLFWFPWGVVRHKENNLLHTNFIFFYIFGTVWYHVLLLKSFTVVFAQQGEELECDFGTEQRYEATWMNGSVVKCSGITVRSLELYLTETLIIIKLDSTIASSCFSCSYLKSLFFEFTLLVR